MYVYISQNKGFKLAYWDRKFEDNKYNAGDLLSPYIVQAMTKNESTFEKGEINFYAIGSVINNNSLNHKGIYWGTGMQTHKVVKHDALSIFTAVRGPRTRKTLLDAGYKCPDTYGDPALLLPRFYKPVVLSKRYKIGVICHWRHQRLINLPENCEGRGIKWINILRRKDELLSIIDEIVQCEVILSSSLHGIILANSYGIPARQFVVNNFPLEGEPNKKFKDYYESVKMPIQDPIVLDEHTTVDDNFKFSYDRTVDLNINLQKLYDAFPF